MFGAIGGLIADFGARAGLPASEADGERVALAALLAHVAAIDGVVEDSEAEALETMLAERFALGLGAARRLISAAHKADEEANDFSEFVSSLKRSLGPQERARVISLMWDMARVDGHVHEFEEALIARVETLLEAA